MDSATQLTPEQEDKVRLELPDIARRLKAALSEVTGVDLVVGIATGGTVLASLAAYELGLPLSVIWLNYRAEDNTPQHKESKLQRPFAEVGARRVLLVDDVSVTGMTFRVARTLLKECEITTLALKGRVDVALYPEVERCILLPWRDS